MLTLTNIYSVTDFQRNSKNILRKIKASKSPVVLTVNGRAELVMQDAESYQLLLNKVAAFEDLEAIYQSLGQALAGQGRSAADFFGEFEAQHGLEVTNDL